MVLARTYGVAVVGSFALAYAPVLIAGTLSNMQEGASLVREIALLPRRAPRITALFVPVLTFSTAISTLTAALGAVAAYALFHGPVDRPDLIAPVLCLYAGYVLGTNVAWNADMVLATFRAGRTLFWLRLANALVLLVAGVALGTATDSVWGLVGAQLIADGTGLVLRAVVLRRYLARASRAELRDGFRSLPDILRFGVRIAPGSLAQGVGNESTTLMLGALASTPAVGAWTRAWQLSSRMWDATHRVAEVLYPTLVERRARGDHASFDGALVESARIVAGGLLFLAAVVGGAAESFMSIYGPGFDAAADALAILLFVAVLYCVTMVQGTALIALDRPGHSALITALHAVVIIALAVPLISWFGITGAALAQLGGYVVDLVVRTIALRGHVSAAAVVPIVRPAAALVAAYVAGFAGARVVDEAVAGPLGLPAALTAGTACFAVALVATGGVTPGDRERLSAIAERVRDRRSPRLRARGQA